MNAYDFDYENNLHTEAGSFKIRKTCREWWDKPATLATVNVFLPFEKSVLLVKNAMSEKKSPGFPKPSCFTPFETTEKSVVRYFV